MNLCLYLNISTNTSWCFNFNTANFTTLVPNSSGAASSIIYTYYSYSVSTNLDQTGPPNPLSSSSDTPYIRYFPCHWHHVTGFLPHNLWNQFQYGQSTLLLWLLFRRLPSSSNGWLHNQNHAIFNGCTERLSLQNPVYHCSPVFYPINTSQENLGIHPLRWLEFSPQHA